MSYPIQCLPEIGYTLPFVVRNGTSHAIKNLQGNGTIKSSAGKIVGSGSDQGFNPTRLLPGQEAFAFIYIQNGSGAPPGSTMKITVSSQPSSSPDTYFADLVVSGADNTGQQVVGLVRNPRKHAIQGPGTVNVYCVTASGQFLGQVPSDVPNIPKSG